MERNQQPQTVVRHHVAGVNVGLENPSAATETAWYQKAVIYELHVRAFLDSDGNGSGDFNGLIQKLDYIQDLGVTAIWMLPFCPSPWKDDGYDISDFVGIHPAYGRLEDFRKFLSECKQRNLRVITELVLNHTSDQHPWFQRARQSAPGSPFRDFYVWSDSPAKYDNTRIIFKDFETSNWTWDPVAHAYYWHRFYSHQPDLNYASPDVRQAVMETVDFWFSLGVDGLRLDAVPYLFECEDTTCENLPETHEFLRELRAWIDERHSDRMLLAEANQWPEDAVAYFGAGDECHMAFNFPLMPRLFMATRMEDSFPVTNIIRQTPKPPQSCQWATFLRNHDELTLEMVCDQERDYMYRTYAPDPRTRINLGIRRRLAPLLDNDQRLIRLMNALVFSLPGTPVLYYGDEIGMGDDLSLGDRNGVRTPMQWSAEPNAGFSSAKTDSLYLPVIEEGEFAHSVVNVEAQIANRTSLLWWMRHALAIRRNSEALTLGETEFLSQRNRHVLAFLRRAGIEDVLVVANLSRYAQPVQLDLSEFTGRTPVEAFGRVEFPPITTELYQLSLSPYAFYWFVLRKPEKRTSGRPEPHQITSFDWEERETLAEILTTYLQSLNVARPRLTTHVEIIDMAVLAPSSAIAIARVSFTAGDPELQMVPLTIAHAANRNVSLQSVIAEIRREPDQVKLLCIDASAGGMSNRLTGLISDESELTMEHGVLRGTRLLPFPAIEPCRSVCLMSSSATGFQRNTSVLLSDLYVLKLFRNLERGTSPEITTVRFLFEEAGFSHVAPVFGKLTYLTSDGESIDAGLLKAFVENRADLWQMTQDELLLHLEQAATEAGPVIHGPSDRYMDLCRLLGRRTAEMHRALSTAGPEHPGIEAEPFDQFSLRGASYSMTSLAGLVRQTIEDSVLPNDPNWVETIAALDQAIEVFRNLTGIEHHGLRMRTHGDFHLGQVLHTGEDLVFIDFEGDSSRPLAERLIKTSPLADVASMLHSLRYAATSVLFRDLSGVVAWHEHSRQLKERMDFWYRTVANAFVTEYRTILEDSPILPSDGEDFADLLHIHVIEKAVYQIAYELRHRPDWVPAAAETFLWLLRRSTKHIG